MHPSFEEIATPILVGACLMTGLIFLGMIYARIQRKKTEEAGFWGTVLNTRGKAPSFRDKMILTGIILLTTGILLVLLYAWTIGFSGFSGQVEKKTVTSLGKYGDYALQLKGEIYRVSSKVYHAAEKGSRISRLWGRPYVIVDDKPYVRAFPLGFFGGGGLILVFLCAGFLLLCWRPCHEAHPTG